MAASTSPASPTSLTNSLDDVRQVAPSINFASIIAPPGTISATDIVSAQIDGGETPLPPICNTGVTQCPDETAITSRIDYFRARTVDQSAIFRAMTDEFHESQLVPSPPLYGYTRAFKSLLGGLLMDGGHTPEMGVMVQWSGKAIEALEESRNQHSAEALVALYGVGFRPSRLDVALDVKGANLAVIEAIRCVRAGDYKSRQRKWNVTGDATKDSGQTLYGGGQESEKRIRIYDKAAETGVEGDWTRVEVVLSDDYARAVWAQLCSDPRYETLGALARKLILSVVDFPGWQQWQLVMRGADLTLPKLKRPDPAQWKWLCAQVMPVFQRARELDGDWQFLHRFVDAVKSGIEGN